MRGGLFSYRMRHSWAVLPLPYLLLHTPMIKNSSHTFLLKGGKKFPISCHQKQTPNTQAKGDHYLIFNEALFFRCSPVNPI